MEFESQKLWYSSFNLAWMQYQQSINIPVVLTCKTKCLLAWTHLIAQSSPLFQPRLGSWQFVFYVLLVLFTIRSRLFGEILIEELNKSVLFALRNATMQACLHLNCLCMPKVAPCILAVVQSCDKPNFLSLMAYQKLLQSKMETGTSSLKIINPSAVSSLHLNPYL